MDSPVRVIGKLVPKAIACFLVDLSKGNALARGNGRVQGDGQETKESFKKPFQCARGTKLILHTRRHARTALKWLFGFTFLSLIGQG